MDKSRLDWPVLIFIGIVLAVGCFGAGMITGSALGQSRPSATTSAVAEVKSTPTPAQPSSATPTLSPTQIPTPTPTPAPTPIPSLTWSPTPGGPTASGFPQCSFADFPFYPGSDNYHGDPAIHNAWYVDQLPSTVASYFARGAYQQAWAFVPGGNATPAPGMYPIAYHFRFTRAPACRGELTVSPYSRDRATVYEAIPDAP